MLFGSEGPPSWHPGGMRLIALLWLMMLSGNQDNKGSGTGESLVDMSGCLLDCLLMWKEVNVEWVIVSIK